ncbi:MAG: electron transfer flavoprotein subunit alpha/FixB family protein [Desulfobacteraceae bacterium]|nr:electron transfer flavoprotein subunit alpha/FixB family protein [Desulfobacteraceae bacterium]
MAKSVCVIAEFQRGGFRSSTFEVASEGRKIADGLGCELCAIALGAGVAERAPELGRFGVDRVFVTDEPFLEHYLAEVYVPVIADVLGRIEPAAILLPASADGKDLGASLAGRLREGLAQDCTEIVCDASGLKARRPVFGGGCDAWCKWAPGAIPIITCRPNTMDCSGPDMHRSAETIRIGVEKPRPRSEVLSVQLEGSGGVELTEASIIVSGGRGMQGAENFAMLEELAGELGAAVGASRAAVEANWRPYADQVGQTGKIVSPALYIAVGISGSIQHFAGMGSSKCIVAVNNNPEAPILGKADYAVLEDLFEFIPLLTEEVRKIRSGIA